MSDASPADRTLGILGGGQLGRMLAFAAHDFLPRVSQYIDFVPGYVLGKNS